MFLSRFSWLFLLALLFINLPLFSQEFELTLFDNYFSPDANNTYTISFSTSVKCRSEVEIQDIGKFVVSDTLTVLHFKEITFNDFNKDGSEKSLKIKCFLENGDIIEVNDNTITLPFQEKTEITDEKYAGNYTFNTIAGISLWLLPIPGIQNINKTSYFSLSKELPLISLGSSSSLSEYPYGYFAVEYNHTPKGLLKNAARVGYKHIFQINYGIRYTSIGLTGFSNFEGLNGLSPELSISLFRFFNKSFDFYIKYRYDIFPEYSNMNCHNIQVGLFTTMFNLHFNL